MTTSSGTNADLFMHPQSCIIEEVQDEEEVEIPSNGTACNQQQQQEAQQAGPSLSSEVLQDVPAATAAPAAGTEAVPAADAANSAAAEADNDSSAAGDGTSEPSSSTVAAEQPDLQQQQTLLDDCEKLKQQGNAAYTRGEYEEALQLYWQAIDQAPEGVQQRAVYYCNAAACYIKKELWQLAAEQCTQALKLDDSYIKALMRRSQALKEMDDLEHALADAQRVLELDAGNTWATKVVADLTPEVQQRQEKLKEEMLGKLKDLGNSLLGKFGLSLDNFKAEQDPNSGGYSIKFVQ